MTDVLYHWAPSDRRKEILNEGLKLFSEPTFHRGIHNAPYLCFAYSPSAAWSISVGAIHLEVEGWDLWQVTLPTGADVRPNTYFEGQNTPEIRTYTPIPADHIWYVASREPEVFE
jgi:hypothetical protein